MTALATFPWKRLMVAGLGMLRLPPDVFWAMTPRELMAALEGAGLAATPGGHMSRAEIEGLMARFPDDEGKTP
ncbi:MAG: rcc01693 family protein [Hyphomicrobiales bacterium]